MQKFIVKDSMGKILDFYGESECFETAWGKIYENFDHLNEEDFDEQMSEFWVEELEESN